MRPLALAEGALVASSGLWQPGTGTCCMRGKELPICVVACMAVLHGLQGPLNPACCPPTPPPPPPHPSCPAVEVVLEDDLRDACKPGDRVAICGIYKPVAPRANGSVSGALRSPPADTGWQLPGGSAHRHAQAAAVHAGCAPVLQSGGAAVVCLPLSSARMQSPPWNSRAEPTLPGLLPSRPAGVFRAVVVANSVQKLSRDAQGPTFTEEDYDNITVGCGLGCCQGVERRTGHACAPSA